MKANEDKLLEKLVATIMKDSKLEKPSLDFTTEIMSQVLASKTCQVYVYKPLISKYVFILFIVFFITLIFYLEPQTDNWINRLSHNMSYNKYSLLFSFSNITISSVVIATLMLLIQISILKKHFENQLQR